MLKDEALWNLARTHNVAQFVSFSPGVDPPSVRYLVTQRGMSASPSIGIEAALRELLEVSRERSINIRCFTAESPNGNPFHFGLTDVPRAQALVEQLAALGYTTIVNETLSVDDGGVSGVCEGGVLEFSPDTTPRGVEGSDSASLAFDVGRQILSTTYGVDLPSTLSANKRTEFSIHPGRVGVNEQRLIVWEQSDNLAQQQLRPIPGWPNAFSRLVGDKTYGLLVADAMGLLVPRTRVIGRRVAPFEFGQPTTTGETWLRTAPADRSPGTFTTTRTWVDPFKLLETEDPDIAISSILAQDGVDARYSGSVAPVAGGPPIVEGVASYGDGFMLGAHSPEALPDQVVADVGEIFVRAVAELGDVSFEWVHDGAQVWVVQLHHAVAQSHQEVLVDGEPRGGWVSLKPGRSLDEVRATITSARDQGKGILLQKRIGITSHVGDLLRKSGVPARIA